MAELQRGLSLQHIGATMTDNFDYTKWIHAIDAPSSSILQQEYYIQIQKFQGNCPESA
jgi:hypothetical protein